MAKEGTVQTCGKCDITYILKIKQVKNINMRVMRNGEVVVSANPFVAREHIDDFVAAKAPWIRRQQQQLAKQPALMDERHILLLGNPLKIRRIKGRHPLVYYSEDTFYIQYVKREQCDRICRDYLNQLCQDIFNDIALLTYKRLKGYGIEMPVIKLRAMKSQWGNCKPQRKEITLNRKLIHYPVEFIEYVILHEFVHLIQADHSKAFYAIVERYMPDYKERIALSKGNG